MAYIKFYCRELVNLSLAGVSFSIKMFLTCPWKSSASTLKTDKKKKKTCVIQDFILYEPTGAGRYVSLGIDR